MAETNLKTNGNVVERAQPAAVAGETFTPRVDILETPDELLLLLDMPGVKPEDVDLHFERGELRVHGKCAPAARPGQCLVQEYETGDFYRAFLISQDVAADRIAAELKNGVLKVHLPKAAGAQARKIAVQG
jgi:HSP20 family protein